MIKDSSGRPRGTIGGTAVRGGAVKYLFTQLPGVGQVKAQVWYDLGLRQAPIPCPVYLAVHKTDMLLAVCPSVKATIIMGAFDPPEEAFERWSDQSI